ncbi:MAG: polysaccharide deacetylase family protein [Acidobacteriota bacterium]|nr:polysaccharide deacetylase family protein [Acidobacteriota bacterium]
MKYLYLFALVALHPLTWAAQPSAPRALGAHPVVTLTFDDLPAAGSLPPNTDRTQILTKLADELRSNRLEGTYGFVNAVDLTGDADAQNALHIWLNSGMNIGNHTWSHVLLTESTVKAFEEEIAKDEPALESFAQVRDWRWFRYPALLEGESIYKRRAVLRYLAGHGYRVARVTLDFQDDEWNDPYARCVAQNDTAAIQWLKQSYMESAVEYIRAGREEQLIVFGHEIPNVLLLHATAFTTLMLPDLMTLLRREGFVFDGLAHVASDPIYTRELNAAFADDGTLTNLFMDAKNLKYPPVKPIPEERLKTICQ